MLRSTYCILSESNDRELTDLGECPYDQGGYFVINGSEKVVSFPHAPARLLAILRTHRLSLYAYTAHVYHVQVLIGQEKMTNNAVYVFRKKQPSKYSHVAEIKSSLDSSRPASSMHMQLLNQGQVKGVAGRCIHATVPYIRDTVPVVVIFRALGFQSDREILEHVVMQP